jgi:transposase-like protein
LVVIAAQENGKGIGRIRMARIADASASSLRGFIEQAIRPGAQLQTDGWEGYAGLDSLGYGHEVTVLRGRGKQAATEMMPRVHLVASLLKRWLMGTHQGSFGVQHLDFYLDEFTFRFNRRTSRSRGKLFFRLLEQAVAIGPSPYKNMVGGAPASETETPQVGVGGVN